MASDAGLASLSTLSEKFQVDVYRKALVAKGRAAAANAELHDVLVYDAETPPTSLLKISADYTTRVRGWSNASRVGNTGRRVGVLLLGGGTECQLHAFKLFWARPRSRASVTKRRPRKSRRSSLPRSSSSSKRAS